MFCVSVSFCHQIRSWFHTWTDSLEVVQCDISLPDLITNIHLKARNLKYTLIAHGVDAKLHGSEGADILNVSAANIR